MKKAILIAVMLAGAVVLVKGATNDLTSALQKGLFEEEANHNLPKAIEAYKSVIEQFDRERKLGATAVFRLGECLRRQGTTNQAVAAYQRILREFADQQALVTLARQNLVAMGVVAIPAAEPPGVKAERHEESGSPEEEEMKRIKGMIKDSPDLINAKSELAKGAMTPLQQAAGKGQMAVAHFLIENGAEVDARDGGAAGRTALHYAAAAGHKGMVELLIESKADVRAADASGETALHLAVEKGFETIVETLLAHGAEINAKTKTGATPLHLAVVMNHQALAGLLIERGADVNAMTSDPFTATRAATHNGTALHIAVALNSGEMVEMLLAHQADPNRVNAGGQTPLRLAAESGLVAVAKALLDHGAQVDAKNTGSQRLGWTALDYAIDRGNKEMAGILLENKADAEARIETPYLGSQMERGITPLLMAVRKSSVELATLLLAWKASPNAGSDAGSLPLADAIGYAQPPQRARLVSILIERGANVDACNPHANAPLIETIEKGDKETAKLLLEHRANARVMDSHRNTALHWAVFMGDRETTAALLAQGVEVNTANEFAATPLQLAKSALGQVVSDRSSGAGAGVAGMGIGRPLATNRSTLAEIAELLRLHGAIDDLPRLNAIEIRRPSANYSETVFTKGTNDYNRFSLLELVAVHYGFVSAHPDAEMTFSSSSFTRQNSLAFPDWDHVTIRRAAADGMGRTTLSAGLKALFRTGDCSGDVSLRWGDVVEIPEAEHPSDAIWPGLTEQERSMLEQCLKRQVKVTVMGYTTSLPLRPTTSRPSKFTTLDHLWIRAAAAEFFLEPALRDSGLLRPNSDLSHVKVRREDPATGQNYELIFDCSRAGAAPEFWLRGGDAIEVGDGP